MNQLEIVDQTRDETQRALDKILEDRRNGPAALTEPLYIEYKPRDGGPTKMLKIVDDHQDPFELSRHKIVSAPEVETDLKAPILREEYQLTEQDKLDWKMPRVVSAWKNPDYNAVDLKDRMRTDPRLNKAVPLPSNRIFDLNDALDNAESEVRATAELEALQKAQREAEEKELKDKYLDRIALKARRRGPQRYRRRSRSPPQPVETEPAQAPSEQEQFDSRLYAMARPASTSAYSGPLFAGQAVREMFGRKDKTEIEFEKDDD